MKYRKKIEEIEAVQFTGSNLEELEAYCGIDNIKQQTSDTCILKTNNGHKMVRVNDWITINVITRDINTCKPDYFKNNYDISEDISEGAIGILFTEEEELL